MPSGYFNGSRQPAAVAPNPLDTPVRRARHVADASHHAVWVQLSGARGGISLGYRARSDRPGSWSARLIFRGIRRETLLGGADDVGCTSDALSYAAAAQAALAWAAAEKAAIENGKEDFGAGPDPTLREALTAYCAARIRRGGENGRNAQWRLSRHVLSDVRLADITLAKLTAASLGAWRRALPAMKPSSLNRLLGDLRAGITSAMPAQALPPALRAALRAEQGATEAREIQVLNLADLRRLLQAAEQLDVRFGHLIRLLVATGARFSQIARLRVGDVQLAPGRNRLMVPASAKGRATKAGARIAVPISDDTAGRLTPLLHGRKGHETLLSRREGVPWAYASEMRDHWHAALAVAGLPNDLVPYAMRHSSIVRMLNQFVPIRFVAAVHDTSVKMLEAHYAKFITSEVEDRIRAATVSFESAEIVTLPVRPRASEQNADGQAHGTFDV